jgi:plastin-1
LVRIHYLQIIGSSSEEDLIKWANDKVETMAIKDFKDKSLSNGKFLIQLCAAIEPRAVNWDIVLPGETDEEKENNAKYILSLARKLGCVIFCVWEDIPKVNYKMILVLVCSLYEVNLEMSKHKVKAATE